MKQETSKEDYLDVVLSNYGILFEKITLYNKERSLKQVYNLDKNF